MISAYHIRENHLELQGVRLIEFSPHIPQGGMDGEDRTIPRIYACASINNCIKAVEAHDYKDWVEDPRTLGDHCALVFGSIIDENLVYRPTSEQVPDVIETNEFWILEPTLFIWKGKIVLDSKTRTYAWEEKISRTNLEQIEDIEIPGLEMI